MLHQPADASGVEIGRRALLLSIGALALTLMFPVLGLALGVFSIVVSVRGWQALARKKRSVLMPVLGSLISSASIVLAALMAWFQTYFGNELSSYTECMKGAGTTTAQQICATDLQRDMERRLPFLPEGSLRFSLPS
ncbi:hypothetical protein Skr01_65500 [Sphaerisporangium krabiense]|uniref:DUF4190 domain-containing protein n=1 Tax=Sphaerisporangium krabiense TaxID=763782 RepID=A0A7W9DP21_9ACTN|nr:hypothetical protein [Sphaerisporangium krabiense]MBB5624835.1 hypothetical protein [Sphaerisporangium krabiense]GII66465.1 hypothetical protein Skr01_65500 [Sphaerisporangium krabiense]